MENICILGATGSIGSSTLDIIRRHPDRYQLVGATGHHNVELMKSIVDEFNPKFVVMGNQKSAKSLSMLINRHVEYGPQALIELCQSSDIDTVMAAIVGGAGLEPNLAAVNAGKKVLLANKESLVMSGELFMASVAQNNVTLLPVDSEHNAIYQSLPENFDLSNANQGIEKILLTASGGPFRSKTLKELEQVTVEQAVAHPNWSMGRKISVDSASLMNKGLEFIEACWLFGLKAEQIEVVVHPQSIIHSMVSYNDGSVIAQMGNPDMRTPIAYCMAWPDRIKSGVEPLDLTKIATLNFEKPDLIRFPNLQLAADSFESGGILPAVLNASNEIAVEAFLNKRIGFLQIAQCNDYCLQNTSNQAASSIETVLEADRLSRLLATKWVAKQ